MPLTSRGAARAKVPSMTELNSGPPVSRPRFLRRLAIIAAGFLAVAFGSSWVAFSRFDGDAFRRDTQAALEAVTGRIWVLEHPAIFEPGMRPAVVFREIRSPNVDWATRVDLVSIARIEIVSTWLSLLGGRPAIAELEFLGLELNLETDGDGHNNWTRPVSAAGQRDASAANELTNLESIRLNGTRVRFRSGWGEYEKTYPVDSIEIHATGADSPLVIALRAKVGGQPLSVNGQLGSPAAMFGDAGFSVALQGRYSGKESDAAVELNGKVGALSGLRDLHLEFSLKADSLNDVGSISGFQLPRDTPVAITAVVTNTGAGPALQDYVLRIGQAIIRPQDAR